MDTLSSGSPDLTFNGLLSEATATTLNVTPDCEVIHDLWFSDDTMVVIQCGPKQFRLPRCILIARSKILDQSISWHTHTSGVLHIKLIDPPDHLEHFLRAIYDSGFFEPPPSRVLIDQVVGILSLASKYKVSYLQKRALSHLSTGYPLTLDAWKHRSENATFLPITDFSIPYATVNIPKSLSVLQHISRVGAFSMLPAIFYECCRYSIKNLMMHPAWEDPELDGDLKKTIIDGQMKHIEASYRILGFLNQTVSERQCPRPSFCYQIRATCAVQALSWTKLNPFGVWDEGDWELLDELCEYCLAAAKTRHAEICEDEWQKLPDMYGLAPWDTLLYMM